MFSMMGSIKLGCWIQRPDFLQLVSTLCVIEVVMEVCGMCVLLWSERFVFSMMGSIKFGCGIQRPDFLQLVSTLCVVEVVMEVCGMCVLL